MSQRLPSPGSDNGTWGYVLNGYLGVAHDSGGNLLPAAVTAAGAEVTTNKGVAGGYAPLNSSSLVPTANLGSGTAGASNFLRGDGTWVVPSGAVQSVFGRTGVVVAASGDYTAAQVGAAQNLIPTSVQNGAYTANPGDFVPVDVSGGNLTITLPTAPADKSRIQIKVINSSASYAATVTTGGSDVFNKTGGVTSITLTLLYQAITLQYAASSGIWYVQGDSLPLSSLDAGIVVTKTTTYTLLTTDHTVLADATSAGFTLTLPTAVGFSGVYNIAAISTGTNLVTLATTSSQTMIVAGSSGITSLTLGTQASGAPYQAIMLVSDGSNWRII